MRVAEKLKAAGVEVVAERTGRSVSVVYRWIKALDGGGRIGERAMREVIAATTDAPSPIVWTDFDPVSQQVAA